ncbi:MAG: hypothetical protein OXL37_09365 [Chloroflexota bacterium]|nr:hypothetical protein [Chloroflexota bacterium]MDE2960068.1 hypothetical protein [Chloroflexota bacterium]
MLTTRLTGGPPGGCENGSPSAGAAVQANAVSINSNNVDFAALANRRQPCCIVRLHEVAAEETGDSCNVLLRALAIHVDALGVARQPQPVVLVIPRAVQFAGIGNGRDGVILAVNEV